LTGKEAHKKGYKYGCLDCGRLFKNQVRTEQYEDGHGGRRLEMCYCGCDLFMDFEKEFGPYLKQ
jgi:hypothetical protein